MTPGILPSALRASLRLFEIAPGDFVAPRARHRQLVVARPGAKRCPRDDDGPGARTGAMSSMARLQRVWGIDISRCPQCGGEVRVIATVTEPAVIARILEHLYRREHEAPQPRGPPPLPA